MNIKKTKFMTIIKNTKSLHLKLNIQINNEKIEEVDNFTYLGINIQNNLKWNTHVNTLVRKIYFVTGIIRRLGNKLNEKIKISIYYAMIHSHLSYLAPIYGSGLPQSELNKLQVAQNASIRKFFANDYYNLGYHTREILHKYGLLNVQQIIDFNSVILYHKIENGKIKLERVLSRVHDSHDYGTRSGRTIRLNFFRSNMGNNIIINSCARLYNYSTDRQITQEQSFFKFKKSLKSQIVRANI